MKMIFWPMNLRVYETEMFFVRICFYQRMSFFFLALSGLFVAPIKTGIIKKDPTIKHRNRYHHISLALINE